MKKLSFWKADWFLGLLVAIVMMIAARGDLIQSLERKAYDLGVKAASRTPSDRIAIDDASIANIGRWPWSRDVHARMIDLLGGAKAKVIANTTFFFEPQRDAGFRSMAGGIPRDWLMAVQAGSRTGRTLGREFKPRL